MEEQSFGLPMCQQVRLGSSTICNDKTTEASSCEQATQCTLLDGERESFADLDRTKLIIPSLIMPPETATPPESSDFSYYQCTPHLGSGTTREIKITIDSTKEDDNYLSPSATVSSQNSQITQLKKEVQRLQEQLSISKFSTQRINSGSQS